MKKLFSATLCGCLLAGCLAAGVSAADPTLLWDFGEDEDMSTMMGSNSSANVFYYGEEDYYGFIAQGSDPYVSIDTPADDVSDVAWVKVRVKNPSAATAIELFGATNGRSLTGSECTHINILPNTEEWHTYIVYIPDENVRTVNAYKDPQYAITEPYWEGPVDWIRLDPMWQEGDDGADSGGSMEVGSEIFIDYVAFFKTEEDAKAFRADQDSYVDVAETPVVEPAAPETEPETEPAPETEPETEPAPETEPETVPETEPETEPAPETEPETVPAPETEPETVPAPAETAAPETTPVAPQTFDAGIIAAVAAIVSAAGYAVAKKRK